MFLRFLYSKKDKTGRFPGSKKRLASLLFPIKRLIFPSIADILSAASAKKPEKPGKGGPPRQKV